MKSNNKTEGRGTREGASSLLNQNTPYVVITMITGLTPVKPDLNCHRVPAF